MKAKKRPLSMARINTRIRQAQQRYIKSVAKKEKLTEGEVFRNIIDFARDNKKY